MVALAHVGDSRAYLYRNGVLHQISHDDTFVQSLVDDGRITAEEAAHHPQRSLLLRALNGTDMDPSITLRETSPGDRFLICSDGLSDVVSPEAIADALAGPDPDQVADTLIQLALVGGGPDNVTVIVADVVDTGHNAGFGIGGGIDPEATGPMQPIHLTQKMPRVPLPPIPEDPPAKAEYAPQDDADEGSDGDDTYDDFDDVDDTFDADGDDGDDAVDADPVGPTGVAGRLAVDPALVGAPRPPRWHRRWAFALAVAVLVGVALSGSYMWTTTKYYVGDNDDQVTVFRGVNGSLLGWKLASAQENSCTTAGSACTPLKVRDLVQAARDQVSAGIPVSTLADARAVVNRLTSQQLPPCPTAAASTSSSIASTSTSTSTSQPAVIITTQPAPSTTRKPPTTAPRASTDAKSTTVPRATTPHKASTTSKPGAAAPGTSARTSPRPGTTARPTVVTPTPVTTTVTVTVLASEPVTSGQRLRAAAPATTPAPIIRPRTLPTPTVTVFTTVTSTPPPSSPPSSATPLVSPAAQPGITCRVVS